MDIEEYYTCIEEYAQLCPEDSTMHDFLQQLLISKRDKVKRLIGFRADLMNERDRWRVAGLLVVGFFTDLEGLERETCFMLCLELDEAKDIYVLEQRCLPYDENQLLIKKEPSLLNKVRQKANGKYDYNLLNLSVFEICSEVAKFNKTYAKIDSYLEPQIVGWARNEYPDSDIYIRINPNNVYDEKPLNRITERITRVANPKWWKNLELHKRSKTGASYVLEKGQPGKNQKQYGEYMIGKVRKLETIVKRNGDGNLSMMIEELAEMRYDNYLYGRVIHMDSDAPFGTPFNDATLNHLDLTLNIYRSKVADQRLDQNLADGKTVKASIRLHLLRIEDIPFRSTFSFAFMFMKSETLLGEWLDDQFGFDIEAIGQEMN